jgi:hypothetical protein
MSTIEERLARDIATVTGGVVVTESDLKEARDVLDGRIERRRQRDRHRILAATAAAVVISVVGFIAFETLGGDDKSASPVNPGPTTHADPYADFLTGRAPTPDLLNGVWRVDNGTVVVRFSPPNRISFDDGGRLFANPGIHGTYLIAGDLITVSVDGGTAGCAGQTFAIRAALPEPGDMRFVHTQPGAGNCAPEFVQLDAAPGSYNDVSWVLEQVLPTEKGLAGLDFSGDHFRPVADTAALYGDWMAQGGGYVLELMMSPNGGFYHVIGASGDVVDLGSWTLHDSRSQLRLVSRGNSDTCDEGDRLVLGDLALADSDPTAAFSGTVTLNTCDAPWMPKTWILIPHEGT